MDKIRSRRIDLKLKLNDCTISEAIKISRLISPELQDAFNSYYFAGKTLRKISNENGITYQAVQYRKDKAIDEILRIFGSQRFIVKTVKDKNANNKVILNLRKKASEVLKGLDYQYEVAPHLNAEEKEFFKNFIFDFNQSEYEKLSGQTSGEKNKSLFYKFRHNLGIVKSLIRNKKEQDKFFKSVGGAEGLSDIFPYFNNEEILLIDENILELSPHSSENFRKKYCLKSSDLGHMKESLYKFIDSFNSRKLKAKEFVENNGGETFLLHQFGSTLDDTDFYILTSTLMDYHYRSEHQFSLDSGAENNFISSRKIAIKKKLSEYICRKTEIDNLIKNMGEDKFNLFCQGLSNNESIVLFDYILSYAPCSKSELQQNLHLRYDKVNEIIDKLSGMLVPYKVSDKNIDKD